MRNGNLMAAILLLLVAAFSAASANAQENKANPFEGKLFPPNVILENQAQLGLTKEQFTEIRAAVVAVQADVAEFEWDMREAYLNIMAELEKNPIDEKTVLEYANTALLAENQVKKRQMAMLIRLKNLLTDEQVAYLESRHGK